jgi:hypothetical protein
MLHPIIFNFQSNQNTIIMHHLEVDEFWTYVGEKKNKVWLIYAYNRESVEIVSLCMG